MGGIFLLLAVIAVYIICYWNILIELESNKNIGFLGFHDVASESLQDKIIQKKSYHSQSFFKKTTDKNKIKKY